MNTKKSGLILFFAGATMLAPMTGCRKTLDVNQNPNALSSVSARQLLSSAEVSIAQAYGNYFQIAGGFWAQYWTQNPVASQYKSFDQYDPGPSSATTVWQLLYAGALKDLEELIEKNESPNYTAVAMLLKAYTFQLLTDNFGDIPFSEALRGDDGISSPKYDAQEAVYNGLIAMVRQATALIDESGPAPENDVIFGGDMHHWLEFANTLQLRLHLRLSNVNPALAQSGIAALVATSPDFLSTISADVSYTNEAGNANPLYTESHTIGNQNIIASSTAIDSFRVRLDPRIGSFYFANGTPYRGLRQGDFTTTNTTITYAYPGAAVGGIANPTAALDEETQSAPVRLLSNYESYFLQAEAQARGWLAGSAASSYEDGIRANMDYYALGNDVDSLVDDYIARYPFPSGGSLQDQLRAIITEKYYAMSGNQNIEAWTEWRRTGFPGFFRISIAPGAGSQFPARLPYPETEITRNLNFPGQKTVFERVYWDIN